MPAPGRRSPPDSGGPGQVAESPASSRFSPTACLTTAAAWRAARGSALYGNLLLERLPGCARLPGPRCRPKRQKARDSRGDLGRRTGGSPPDGQESRFLELYGVVLAGGISACDAALDREVAVDVEVELPAVDSVLEVMRRGARRAQRPLLFSLAALGDAIWIYGTSRDRASADARDEAPRSSRLRRAGASRRR